VNGTEEHSFREFGNMMLRIILGSHMEEGVREE
jgi:hypothetical protein